jgi:hypothetical protein
LWRAIPYLTAHPAGVGADVAADAGRQLAGLHHVPQPVGGGRDVQLDQRHTGLDDGDLIDGVDFEDLVHALEGDDQTVFQRCRRAGQAGSGSAGRHGNLVLGGHFQQLRNLVGAGRFGDVGRLLRRTRQFLVVPVVLGDRVTGQQVVVPDDAREPGRDVAHGWSSRRKGCRPSTAPTNGGWML